MASPDKGKEFVVFFKTIRSSLLELSKLKFQFHHLHSPPLAWIIIAPYVITNASLIAKLCFSEFGLEIWFRNENQICFNIYFRSYNVLTFPICFFPRFSFFNCIFFFCKEQSIKKPNLFLHCPSSSDDRLKIKVSRFGSLNRKVTNQ